MTKYSFATALAKFDACGYNTTCELVSVNGGKMTVRCLEHGHEFVRDNVILNKPQKKLRCPECHKRNVAAMLEWYAAGHSTVECAEKFGMTKAQVTNYAMKHGVSGGIYKAEAVRRMQANNGTAKGNATQMRRAAERIRKRVELHGFYMFDEWRGRGNVYRVRCRKCGHEFELTDSTLKNCRFKCPECPDPLNELKEAVREMRGTIAAIKRATAEARATLDKLDAWAAGEYSRYKDTLEAHAPQVATCRHCGGRWVHWTTTRGGYRKWVPPAYCSRRCRVKANSKSSEVSHRLKKHGNGDAPRDVIHLRDLYERDGGICQICGEPCDWNDCVRLPDGTILRVGRRYPTIDHIIALANGGTHTWDNVQLAHHHCNCVKGARNYLHMPLGSVL